MCYRDPYRTNIQTREDRDTQPMDAGWLSPATVTVRQKTEMTYWLPLVFFERGFFVYNKILPILDWH